MYVSKDLILDLFFERTRYCSLFLQIWCCSALRLILFYQIFAYWCMINLKTSASQNDNAFSCKLPISQVSQILIIYRFSNFPISPAREFSKQRQLLCQLFPVLIIKYDNSSLIQLFFVSFSLRSVTFRDKIRVFTSNNDCFNQIKVYRAWLYIEDVVIFPRIKFS